VLGGAAFDTGRGLMGAVGSRPASTVGGPLPGGLVATMMRELGVAGCQPRAYKRTTVTAEQPQPVPDLIDRDFTPPNPAPASLATSPAYRGKGSSTWPP